MTDTFDDQIDVCKGGRERSLAHMREIGLRVTMLWGGVASADISDAGAT